MRLRPNFEKYHVSCLSMLLGYAPLDLKLNLYIGKPPMNIEEFWAIVDRVHAASPNDMNARCQALANELRQLPATEILSFGNHFGDCYCKAYTWDGCKIYGTEDY
jgi:hypothetical protein